jgi:hypothetical protein
MTNYVLRPGIHLLYDGREHVIEQRLPDNSFRLKDLATSQCTAVANESLVDGVFEGQVELLGPDREYVRVKKHNEKTRVADLTALADDDPRKKAAKRRLAYVEGMKERGQVKFTKEFLRPVIEKVGAALGEMPHDEFKRRTKAEQAELKKSGVRVQPSPASLFRWYTDYEKASGDIRALVPAFKSQGNFTRKIADDEEKTEAVLRLIEVSAFTSRRACLKRLSRPSWSSCCLTSFFTRRSDTYRSGAALLGHLSPSWRRPVAYGNAGKPDICLY